MTQPVAARLRATASPRDRLRVPEGESKHPVTFTEGGGAGKEGRREEGQRIRMS